MVLLCPVAFGGSGSGTGMIGMSCVNSFSCNYLNAACIGGICGCTSGFRVSEGSCGM